MESELIASAIFGRDTTIFRSPKKLYTFREMGNLRPILEVFKFLSPKEVFGVARVSKQFYEASFHFEVRKPVLKEVEHIEGCASLVLSVAVSGNGDIIACGIKANVALVWNLVTGESTEVRHSNWVYSVAISNNAGFVVSGSGDKMIKVKSLVSNKRPLILRGHTGDICSVAICSRDRYIVSGSSDKTIRVWSLAAKKQIRVLEGHSGRIESVAISKTDQFIVSGSTDSTVRVWSFASGHQIRVLQGHSSTVNSVVISSDDKFIASGSADKTIRIWSLTSGEITQLLEGHTKGINSVNLSSNNKYLASESDYEENPIKVFDPDLLPDYTPESGYSVKVWDLTTGQKIQEFKDFEFLCRGSINDSDQYYYSSDDFSWDSD